MVCVVYVCGVGGCLKRKGHKLMVWTMYHNVGVCYQSKVGFDGLVGHGMGLSKGMTRGYMEGRDGAQDN